MRILIASIVSAIVLFMFGFFWWGWLMMVVLPAEVLADQTLVDQIQLTLPQSGIYIHPDYAAHDQAAGGPMTMLYYQSELPPMVSMLGAGFIHMLATAFLVSLIVWRLEIPAYIGRLSLVFALGLFVAVWADLGNSIWWHHPWRWTAFHFGYDVCSWLLAGIVIAGIVKPNSND